jgi:D-mannonate dehydratase
MRINKGARMKKIIIGFFIFGIMAYGSTQLGNDVVENQKIIDNIKLENEQLKNKIESLNKILNELEKSYVKNIDFKNQGISMERTLDVFTLRIESDNLSNKSYDVLLDSLSNVIKYKKETSVTITGNEKNIDYLKSYFISKGVEESQLKFEILEIVNEEKKKATPMTTITLVKTSTKTIEE